MELVTLPVHIRDHSVKAAHLRKQSLIPAEFYGHGLPNMSFQMDYQTFRKLFKTAGFNTVLTLEVEGNGTKSVLVHELDRDPVSNLITHVEFINVRMDERVTTTVPIHLEGTAPAVRDLAGVLIQHLDELEISCLPGDLIHEVVLNVESLVDFNTTLHVSDIRLSDKIQVLTDLETAIATVSAPREEEVAPVEAPTAADVEITTEKKEGEEGGKTESAAPADEEKKE